MLNEYDDLLNVEEACEALRIGRNYLYALLAQGRLKAFRCGRVWKIPKLAIEQFILEQAKLVP